MGYECASVWREMHLNWNMRPSVTVADGARANKEAGSWRAGLRSLALGYRLLVVLSELNILKSPFGKSLVLLCNLGEVSLYLVEIALAGSDDSLQVGDLRILAVSGLESLVILVGEEICKNGVVAASLSILQVGNSLLVVAGEDVDDTLVGLCDLGAGLLEQRGSLIEVAFAESEDTESVGKLLVLGLDVLNLALSLSNLSMALL